MNNIEITYDKETGYYSAIVLDRGISTQGKNLDNLIINLGEAFSLSKKETFQLTKFNISFEDNYVTV